MQLHMLKTLVCTMAFFSSTQLFAAPYLRCSEDLENKLIQQFKLANHKFADKAETFKSCISLDGAQKQQLLAISQSISYQADDEIEYDLHLYLIDSSQNKILQHYKDPVTYTSDADHYDGVKLDLNRFSTLANTHVVGVETASSHQGGFSYSHNNLALFKIDPKQSIHKIFNGIGTNESGYVNANCGADNPFSEVKRILVLSNKTSHGLQDIILKEQKNQVIGNENTCKVKRNTFKQQQVIKFDGKQYRLQHDNLLGIDPF